LTPPNRGNSWAFSGLRSEIVEHSKKASARFYLRSVVFPVLDGLAEKEKVSIEQQITNMIRRDETLHFYENNPDFKKRFDDTLGNPAVRHLLRRFRAHLDTTEEEIRGSIPWWFERMRKTRPEICSVITNEPNGENWLGTIFVDIVNLCRRYAA